MAEIIAGIILLAGYFYRPALKIFILFILTCIAVNAYSLFSGNATDCNYFGGLISLPPEHALIIDITLLLISIFSLLNSSHFSPAKFQIIAHKQALVFFRFALLIALLLVSSIHPMVQAEEETTEISIFHPIMKFTREQLEEMETTYRNAPLTSFNTWSMAKASASLPSSHSLLPHLQYNPSERDQGLAGNCWVWAGTGVMEIALDVDKSIKDRLSIQYFDSNFGGGSGFDWAGCGGNLNNFAYFYNNPYQSQNKAIPWSNTNASYQDASRIDCPNSASVAADTISLSPNYPTNNDIQALTISTTGVGQATAIANIKNTLLQDRAICVSIFFPSHLYWDGFFSFWDNESETSVWNPSSSCDSSLEASGGGHEVLCVGYNQEDINNPYWIMLNSWGTTTGRPNGLFRLSMNMNYDCQISNGNYPITSFKWLTLSSPFASLTPSIITDDATNIGASSATLNCRLVTPGDSLNNNISFQWGPTSNTYPNETAAVPTTIPGLFSTDIEDLTSGTTYYFRAKAAGDPDSYGSEKVFTAGASPPSAITTTATNISSRGATLNSSLTSLGDASSVTTFFEYGATTSYGSTTIPQVETESGDFSVTIATLIPETLYHFRAKVDGGIYGGSTASDQTFTTLAIPTIASISPPLGTTTGGTLVTITGTGFVNANTSVTIGGIAATGVTFMSSTSVTAITPAASAGAKNVVVSTPGGSATLLNGFTYKPAPTITTFTPKSGAPDTQVVIIGTNLIGVTAVSFGDTPASSFTVDSSTQITAVVGKGATGNITATTPIDLATSADSFTFVPCDSVNISLEAGWNLISVPWYVSGSGTPPDALLSTLGANLNTVYAFDACTSQWSAWNNGIGGALTIDDGKGYWVNVTSPVQIALTGTLNSLNPLDPLPQYSVCTGWNLIGFKNGCETTSISAYIDPPLSVASIYAFDNGGWNIPTTLEPGLAYWVAFINTGVIYP